MAKQHTHTRVQFIMMAASYGAHHLDAFIDEFGQSPKDAGAEAVGDWDSTAWSEAWRRLQNNGATDSNYDDCLASWRTAFWNWEPHLLRDEILS